MYVLSVNKRKTCIFPSFCPNNVSYIEATQLYKTTSYGIFLKIAGCSIYLLDSAFRRVVQEELLPEKITEVNRIPIYYLITAFFAYIQRRMFCLFYYQLFSIDHIQQSHSSYENLYCLHSVKICLLL